MRIKNIIMAGLLLLTCAASGAVLHDLTILLLFGPAAIYAFFTKEDITE